MADFSRFKPVSPSLSEIMITIPITLVVSYKQLISFPPFDKIRTNWNLAAATGRVEHVHRDGEPGRASVQFSHNFLPSCYRRTEMSRTDDGIALVEVVRANTQAHEPLEQCLQCLQPVVDIL